jgi:clan AA aspartic protease
MISGQVTSQHQAVVEIEISAPQCPSQSLRAVVDTGFTGYLTLPIEQIRAMWLPFAGYRRGQVADGRKMLLERYLVDVNWHGKPQPVLAAMTKGAILIGMSLLTGSELHIDVIENGSVIIEKRR